MAEKGIGKMIFYLILCGVLVGVMLFITSPGSIDWHDLPAAIANILSMLGFIREFFRTGNPKTATAVFKNKSVPPLYEKDAAGNIPPGFALTRKGIFRK